jgi:hypothetical protein
MLTVIEILSFHQQKFQKLFFENNYLFILNVPNLTLAYGKYR